MECIWYGKWCGNLCKYFIMRVNNGEELIRKIYMNVLKIKFLYYSFI